MSSSAAPATTAAVVRTLARTLPPWRPDLHDDPRWLLPPAAVGLHPLTDSDDPEVRRHLVRARHRACDPDTLPPAAPVPTATVCWTVQPWLRIDALAHYLDAEPDDLFDADGWFGTDHPVLATLPDARPGYVVLDGNNRVAAARLRGATHLTAHLLG